jgi:WD40 repeat protein
MSVHCWERLLLLFGLTLTQLAGTKLRQKQLDTDLERVSELLGAFSSPEDDLTTLLDLWRPGTCESSLANPDVMDWKTAQKGSKILWVHDQPGSGKSVRLAVHARHLKENGYPCSYYFFKYGDSTKRSPGSLLRSLAFQIAREVTSFRTCLIALNENGMKVEKMEARMIWEKLFVGILFRLDLRDPIYLLIDALDESDSINTIVMFISSITVSKTPIRVMLTSRKTPDITTAMDRISSKVSIHGMAATNNINDIRFYSEQEMEYMHGDAEFKQHVVDQIVERAEGNFLWVHLALKEILQCHSPEDVQEVLSEMPPGMEALYKRMEAAISRLSRPSDLTLAKMILSWATYSRVPLTADELVRALQPGTPSIIDLRYTISQVCGHFVAVDGNSRVTLVHQTAKEYLTKQALLPFSLNSQEVQEALFRKALGIFLEPHVRTKLIQKPMPPFYEYAATSWAYHLERSSAGSDGSLSLVVKFLQSPTVLLWIRLLAASHQLKTLITTSDALHSFVKRRKMMDATIPPSQHRFTDLETLEKWAVDLLKLVGKFGSHLLEDPDAIQTSIPQFCPKNSAIFRQFGKQANSSVKGISNDDWDDCLGRVSIRSGHQATQMICSTRHLAVLTSGGSIVLWGSVTFEEFRSVSHDEHIFTACFSENGDTLASYGYRTTKIWSVLTGKLIHQITNQLDSRPLAMTFAQHDSRLIVGLDTRRVAEVLLEEVPTEWTFSNSSFLQEETVPDSSHGIYLNAPTDMAFNSEATYVVVSYRGFPMALWGMIEQKQIKRCRRRPDHDHKAGQVWTGVYKVVWHPSNEEVLGIYTDGAVFKWNPFEDVHEELQTDLYAAPSNIQVSPNGVVFATSDAESAVKLYNYEHFSLIYQLSSEDIITSLCFSPDSRRFYDVRGSYCNIWEPNALFRLPDIDERGSAIDTEIQSVATSSHAAEAWAEISVPITALASQRHGSLFCYGNEDGLVCMNDITAFGPKKVGNSRGEMSIQFLGWADDGQNFAYSDNDIVTIKKLNPDTANQNLQCDTVLDLAMDLESGKIHQILLNHDITLVLVVETDSVMLWSSRTKELSKTLKNEGLQRWANHPTISSQILAFSPDAITAYSWESLETLSHWVINSPTRSLKITSAVPPEPERKTSTFSNLALEALELIEDVIISQGCFYALILISRLGSYHKRSRDLIILDISHLQDSESSLDPMNIPEVIASSIERPLAMLGNDHFVFINKSYWVCSWHLGSTLAPVKYFFLPRDWVSADVLDLCKVMEDGTFLCPRKGEVAVIRSSLGRQF